MRRLGRWIAVEVATWLIAGAVLVHRQRRLACALAAWRMPFTPSFPDAGVSVDSCGTVHVSSGDGGSAKFYPQQDGTLVPDKGYHATDTLELADIILSEAKVALVPGEAFGAPGYARLSFALADKDLEEGIRRLQKLFA